jgi:hypothetical protein
VIPSSAHRVIDAGEKGLPFIGNAHKMGKELFPPLFEKHGGPFMIDLGPLGGWCLAINNAEDIFECLSRSDDFDVSVPGAFSAIRTSDTVTMVL